MADGDDIDAFARIAVRMDMIESYAISAVEAARRRERHELEMRLKQIRSELMAAIATFKTIDEKPET